MRHGSDWLVERINSVVPTSGQWSPADLAVELVAKLKAEEPSAFAEWLDDHAAATIQQIIIDRHRADRARAISQGRAGVFAQATRAHAAGDEAALDPYRIVYVIDEPSGTRMTLGEMTGHECRAAAVPFHRRVNENAMQAAFLEAVAKRAKSRKVSDVLTREQLAKMLASIGGQAAAA